MPCHNKHYWRVSGSTIGGSLVVASECPILSVLLSSQSSCIGQGMLVEMQLLSVEVNQAMIALVGAVMGVLLPGELLWTSR